MMQPMRVLIADDHAHTREGLRALLATWAEIAVVGEAANGEEAVRMAAECRPDAVLMDMHMPVMDGAQATQRIKQHWPAITVVVLTMYATEQSAAMAAGADAFILKGGVPDQLLTVLGASLAKKA